MRVVPYLKAAFNFLLVIIILYIIVLGNGSLVSAESENDSDNNIIYLKYKISFDNFVNVSRYYPNNKTMYYYYYGEAVVELNYNLTDNKLNFNVNILNVTVSIYNVTYQGRNSSPYKLVSVKNIGSLFYSRVYDVERWPGGL